MPTHASAARMAAGALSLFLLLVLLPPADAQTPTVPEDPFGQALAITVQCHDTFLEPSYAGQDTVTCTVEDLSRDSLTVPGSGNGQGAQQHSVELSYAIPGNDSRGYQVVIDTPFIPMYGGDVRSFGVNVKATPQVSAQDFDFDLVWVYKGPGEYVANGSIPFHAEVANYDFATVRMTSATQLQSAGQDEVVVYTVEVTNVGVYPDSYRFGVKADPDLAVTVPPNLYVPPGETRTANITVLTPHNKVYEIGRSTALIVKVTSVTGTGVYSTVGVLNLSGAYVPSYWIPVVLVGIVSAAVVTRGATDRLERARHERGKPRAVELTPKQAILLAELRRSDRERYKEKQRALDAVYQERLAEYRAHKKERAAKDREEARQAKIELKAEKKRRKEARKAAALEAKAQRKEEKKRLADERKQAKIEAKEARKKGKVLAKKRKELEKAQAKLAKVEAKEAAARAKADAKAAKEAAKAEKAARKAAKQNK